jgi:hypothetical protein
VPTLDPRLQASLDAYLRACEWAEEDPSRWLSPDLHAFDGHTGHSHIGAGAHLSLLRARLEERPGLQAQVLRRFGGGPELALLMDVGGEEQLWAFRFDDEGRVEHISILREGGPGTLAAGCATVVDGYFRTYNEDDEEGHMALLSPDLLYFGSVSRITSVGLPTARGVFRGARESMGIHRLRTGRWFGRDHDAAVLVKLAKEDPVAPEADGAWIFHFDAAPRVDRLSLLWNPEGFAGRR